MGDSADFIRYNDWLYTPFFGVIYDLLGGGRLGVANGYHLPVKVPPPRKIVFDPRNHVRGLQLVNESEFSRVGYDNAECSNV